MNRRFVLGILLTGLAVETEAQTTRIKLATWAPRGSSYHQMLLAMGEKWRQAPEGGVGLVVYPDGTMGGEPDIVRKMRVGQLQAGLLTVTGLSEIDPSVSALQNMPMMFRSLEEVDHVRKGLQPELEKRLAEKGFLMLAWGDLGWVRIFSKEPVVRPKDLERMKLFVTAGDNAAVELLKAMGYQPVPLEWSDILPGLQTGMIDPSVSTMTAVTRCCASSSQVESLAESRPPRSAATASRCSSEESFPWSDLANRSDCAEPSAAQARSDAAPKAATFPQKVSILPPNLCLYRIRRP